MANLHHWCHQFNHSVVSDSLWPLKPQHARPPCPSPTPKPMSIEWVMPSHHLILCRPLLLLLSIFPSIRVFSNESGLCIRSPKYWSFSFNISPSNEHPGQISFRMDWLDFLAVQGTLRSLLQHHSSKASILWHSAFFIVQLSHPYMFSSVLFSCSVVSDSLRPYEPQHARPPCPSPTPGVHPNPCPLSRWCHPTISSSVIPFSTCPQSFPASGSFQMSHLFASGGPSIGVSTSTSVLPMNTQDWSPLVWTDWISLQSKGFSRAFSQFESSNSLGLSFLYSPTLTFIHDHWKNHSLD